MVGAAGGWRQGQLELLFHGSRGDVLNREKLVMPANTVNVLNATVHLKLLNL